MVGAEAEAEMALKAAFNISEIIWLERGLSGDHTDGHIDNIARFIAPGHARYVSWPQGTNDPHAAKGWLRSRQPLRASGLEVSLYAIAGPDHRRGRRNAPGQSFSISPSLNDAIFMPAFEGHYSCPCHDSFLPSCSRAMMIIALPSNHILEGGGSFHCMST